jgi:hypothetical protein
MKSCVEPVSSERLVEYWAGELEETESERLEEHLMGCAACTAESARVAALVGAMGVLIPPIVTHAHLETLRARGLHIVDNPVLPGERRPAVFLPGIDIILHRLGGLDLAGASRVRVLLTSEDDGKIMLDVPEAPFDADSGEILIACQRHFEVFPPNVHFEVTTHGTSGQQVAHYAVPHQFMR